jgi:lipoyl-dependent peroxiredoxin
MAIKVLYRTQAEARGGRDGHAATLDGELDLKLVIPKELGGPGGAGANPEKLFALGYSACFLSALRAVGGRQISDAATVRATVGIGQSDEGGFGLVVDLSVALPGLTLEDAEALVRRAHHTCPYSNALRGKAELSVHLDGQGRAIE